MSESFQYAFRIDADKEIPCHLSEIKKGHIFYLVTNASKSELFKASEDAFSTEVNGKLIWSIPHEMHQ